MAGRWSGSVPMAASRAGARVLAASAAALGVSLHSGIWVALVSVPPHLLDLFAPFVSIPARVHQVICPVWRVDKEGFKILGLWSEFL